MRKNKIFITVLSVLALLFTQAAAVIPSSAIARGCQEQPIETQPDTANIDSNPLATDGITEAVWQEILGQIQSDEPSTYLKASNTDAEDSFGRRGSIAISDNTIVIGAASEDSNATGVDGNQNDNSARNSGAAYVFVRDSQGNWLQQAYLKASNTDGSSNNIPDYPGDEFGASVAISGDTIVVGAPREASNATGVNGDQSDNSATFAGAAYVFIRDSQGNWLQQAYLKASNTDTGDGFGTSVAISDDKIVVGSPGEASNTTGVNGDQSDNSAIAAGAAYVFIRDSQGNWQQQAYLKASNTDAGDEFGTSVAISGDTIVIGAYREDSIAIGVNGNQQDNNAESAGAAYVFTHDNQGNWQQQAYLKASNTDAKDEFSYSIAISGETIVVGAYGEDSITTGVNGNQRDNNAESAGAAYVFARDNQGNWQQQAYLKASNTDELDSFGISVAISGNMIVVGASGEDSNATGVNGNQQDNSTWWSGAAYFFVRDSQDNWQQQAYLKASNTDVQDNFGCAVSISGDMIVVGAPRESSNATGVNGDQQDNSATSAGAAYVFNVLEFNPPDQFQPYPNGYSFENYNGGYLVNDLTVSDLVQMFGEQAVCESIKEGNCILNAQARSWINWRLSPMKGGRCEGMSVTALRYFAGIDSLQEHESTFSLDKDSLVGRAFGYQTRPVSVRNNIAFFHALQITNPVKRTRNSSLWNNPSELVSQIIQRLDGQKEGMLNLNIYKNIFRLSGHALTPYDVIDKGDGIFWIKVYDNNYPYKADDPDSSDRHVIVDTSRETWEYELGGSLGVWRGNRFTKSMAVVPLSTYFEQPECPWRHQTLLSNTAEQQIFFSGIGSLLITDSQGRRLGLVGETLYEEIPGAYLDSVFGGLGIDDTLIYSLPATDEYTLILNGQQTKQAGEATLTSFGPGYAINLENILVNSSTNDIIVFSDDGTNIAYTPSQNQNATLATAVDTANGSWQLQVNGMPLTTGQQNALTVNTTSEGFTLSANNNDSAEYEIFIMRSSDDGLEMYSHKAVSKNIGETHTIRFGVFKVQNIVILDIDRDGDGVIDESIPLENQAKKLYFPVISN